LLLQAEFSTLSPGTEHSLLAGLIMPLPQRIGYSMAARVEAVGAGVTEYAVGDGVVTTGPHADHFLVDSRNVTPVPEGTDMEQAAFFNLAHTAMYGIRRSLIQLGEPAVVLGQGLVGSITAQLARLAGALPVIVTDIDETRLGIAKGLGAHYAVNTASEPGKVEAIVESIGMGGVPVVFEATGRREPLEQAVSLVKERGRVMMLSTVHGSADLDFTNGLMMKGATLIGGYINSKPFALQRSDITIAGKWPPVIADGWRRYVNSDVWTSDEDIRVILNLIRYGSLNLRPLISHRFSFKQISEAYELVLNREPSLLGGVIDWRGAGG